MKKILFSIVMMLCLITSASCSKSLSLGSNGEFVYDCGSRTGVDEHLGATAYKRVEVDLSATPDIVLPSEGIRILYEQCTDIDHCINNSNALPVDEWTKYKSTHYLIAGGDTQYVMHRQITKDYAVCSKVTLPSFGCALPMDIIRAMYDGIENLTLSSNYTTLDFDGKVTVDIVGIPNYVARKDSVLVKDTILIKRGAIERIDSQISVGGVSLGKMSTTSYDYYQYNDILIQARIGVDIETFLRFK